MAKESRQLLTLVGWPSLDTVACLSYVLKLIILTPLICSVGTVLKCLLTLARMLRRVAVVVLSVCYHASCYIPRFYVEIEVALGFSW